MDDQTNSTSRTTDEPDRTLRARVRGWQAFVRPAADVTAPADRRQVQLLATVLVILLPLVLIATITTGVLGIAQGRITVTLFLLGATEIVLLVAYGFSRTKYYRVGTVLTLALLTVLPFAAVIVTSSHDITAVTWIVLTVILSSIFFAMQGVVATTGFGLVGLLLVALLIPRVSYVDIMSQFGLVLLTGGALLIATRFRDLQERGRQAELAERNRELVTARAALEERMVERTHELSRRMSYLEATAEVAREAASVLDVSDLLSQVVTSVSERFGFYHTGLFLLDSSGKWAVLQAASSPGGQQMLARGHRMPVGTGIVGQAVSQGEPRIALDVGKDAVVFDDPDLPDAHSEVALPLRARGEVIGALDVQSLEPEAFTDEDVIALLALADQVAVAIHNARLFEGVQQSLEAERRAHAEFGRGGWADMVRSRPESGYRYYQQEVTPIRGDGERSESPPEDLPTLTLPVKFGDQVVGTIQARKPVDGGEWTPEEVSLMGTLAEQLSVALDSARLHEEAQRRASREELLGSVGTRIRETLDVESVLKTTAQEVRRALGLPEVVIRLAERQASGLGDGVGQGTA
jgi:GAF domain-containing protein